MMKTLMTLGLGGALLLGATVCAEESWARFRGPDGLGVAADQSVPVEFDEKTLGWSVELAGPGTGSPVVWGNVLFVTGEARKKGTVTLQCLDAKTGEKRWEEVLQAGDYHMHTMNNLASATPCVNEDVVVVGWFDAKKKVAMLTAYSHEGKRGWDFEVGAFESSHGPCVQPVIEDGRVVVSSFHKDGGYVVALDVKTGKPVWESAYPLSGGKASYVTPLVRKLHGSEEKEVVIVSTATGVRGLSFSTGKENWSLTDVFHERCIVSPMDILAGSGAKDSLLMVGCKNGVLIAVRPRDAKAGGSAEVAWKFGKKTPYVPTPVSDGETLYVLDDGGNLSAVDPVNGEVRWKERLMANFYASPLLIGGKLYCVSREGELYVAEVGEKFKLLSTTDLKPADGVAWVDTTPAVAHDSLYVRVGARLDCYRAK